MKPIDTPQTHCRVGVSRGDITPPAAIYHRMWGAAMHDRATGIHRPLVATLLWLQPSADAKETQLIVTMDQCVLDSAELARLRGAITDATALPVECIHITLSHTHGSGWMSRTRTQFPGGDLIEPYLDQVAKTLAELAKQAQADTQPASIVYGFGRCSLAAHRDLWDEKSAQFVCGYNPDGPADDTVLVARITRDDGSCRATIVNYACHPTTLAWENTLVSPDYVGAMREVIEQATGAPCVFLQGASGDLGPREGFVGDTAVADRNGRQLGYAALATLETLPKPRTRFVYCGPVISGAILGPWRHEPVEASALDGHKLWEGRSFSVDLPYRHDLADLQETKQSHQHWLDEEAAARAGGDMVRVRDCRARVEQKQRQINRLSTLPPGKVFPFRVTVMRLGDALWIFAPGELYQTFQVTLRARFPGYPIVVATLTGDWQPGYLPTAASYGYGIYQEIIATIEAGSLETLIEQVTREMRAMV